MVIKNILIGEAVDRFSEVNNCDGERETNSRFDDDGSQVFKCKTYYSINEMGVNIYEAICYEDDKCGQELEDSFSFYIFYDFDNEHIVYEEQGSSLEVCIYNFDGNISMDYIYEHLRCDLMDE